MVFQKEEGAIYLEDEQGARIAEIVFPEIRPGVMDIVRTWVDPSLTGQGVAGELTREAAEQFRREGKKAILTCPYAVRWFAKHPEYRDVVEESA